MVARRLVEASSSSGGPGPGSEQKCDSKCVCTGSRYKPDKSDKSGHSCSDPSSPASRNNPGFRLSDLILSSAQLQWRRAGVQAGGGTPGYPALPYPPWVHHRTPRYTTLLLLYSTAGPGPQQCQKQVLGSGARIIPDKGDKSGHSGQSCLSSSREVPGKPPDL